MSPSESTRWYRAGRGGGEGRRGVSGTSDPSLGELDGGSCAGVHVPGFTLLGSCAEDLGLERRMKGRRVEGGDGPSNMYLYASGSPFYTRKFQSP